eukprot:UN06908
MQKDYTFIPDPVKDLGYKKQTKQTDFGVMEDSVFKRFQGGETMALKTLKDWIWEQDKLRTYKDTRNGLLGNNYSSKFSPWLALGCLSPRMIYSECKKYESCRAKNKSTYWLVFELMWRDFFTFQAIKRGNDIFKIHGPIGSHNGFYNRDWPGTKLDLDKWRTGQTGWPFIDANMREMNETGFMSNRGRQNVASFLALELRVDWRQGAEYFETHLLDHDVASNYGNWCAAAGLFGGRVNRFNIIKQAKDYDKNGDYVRRWIPELKKVPTSKIHEPWKMNNYEMTTSNCIIGKDYPHPVESKFVPINNNGAGRTGNKDRTNHWTKTKPKVAPFVEGNGKRRRIQTSMKKFYSTRNNQHRSRKKSFQQNWMNKVMGTEERRRY